MKTLHMVSLGCPKNLVDSEVMLASVEQAGYVLVGTPEEATVLLVNTCGFIQPAVEEAIDTILELAAYKEDNPNLRLVVTGCMVQRYGPALAEELPEVDLFVGLDDFPRIGTLIEDWHGGPQVSMEPGSATYLMTHQVQRRLATPSFRAFLKITEGCDNRCSYCMIPSIRGRLRSRTIADITAEAQALEAAGVRELSLIAQDLTAYGRDLVEPASLVTLLESLLAATTIPWLRLLYLYPATVTDQLLYLMAAQPRLLPYLDIPFQHVSDQVLQRMNRHYTQATLETMVMKIRTLVPECALRTTIMVGFPGETKEDMDILLAALNRWQLDHVGVFQYQDEEGSLASALPDKVAEGEKEQRYQQVMALQSQISEQRQQRFVGQLEPVLVEGVSAESELLLEGRTRFQAPEVDGCVYITSGQVNPGDIVTLRIIEAHPYDLVGEMPDENEQT